MVKDKHIISEIGSFFPKNDCNRAINCLQRIAFADESKYITLAMRYSTISAEQLIEYACENSGIPKAPEMRMKKATKVPLDKHA